MTCCNTCGAEPCMNQPFCRTCRRADRRRRQPDHRDVDGGGGAPQATVDALLFELRENGFAQLEKPTCLRRLADLSTAQLREINGALVRLKPRYQKITQELIAISRGQL